MRAFAVARLIVLSTLAFFAFITLILGIVLHVNPRVDVIYTVLPGLDANLGPGVASVSSLGSTLSIATSVLTLLITLPGFGFRLFATSQWKRFLSLVWIELCWTVLLAIGWFVTALILTILSFTTSVDLSGVSSVNFHCVGGCGEGSALKGFSWINCLILVIYCIALSGCFQVNNNKGLRGWTMPVDDILVPPGHTRVDLEKAVPELPHGAG